MIDNYGREIDYARISITDRCNLRCVYCMPESGIDKVSCGDILSYEQIVRVCRNLARQGIRKLKITGGEPLVRKDVPSLIASLKSVEGIEHVSLTTNGMNLATMAQALAEAGLDSINISLDTLNPERYRALTRRGSVHSVVLGIAGAVAAGIETVKVNCVPIAGVNEKDLVGLAGLARSQNIHIRFIEMMPIGLGKQFPRVEPETVRGILEDAYGTMTPYRGKLGNGPAKYYALPGFRGKIGFISAISECFCETCNRVRLTADGMLKTCLHLDEGICLLSALSQDDDILLEQQISQAIREKPAQHDFAAETTLGTEQRIMSQIGG
ncbi:MAG: GTP 3',8-cyclase MoaA [Peptococcaceae bacterium]|nr:GTP 3',8-cyclase MoaA [Peptococcaceae bacterium]